MSSQEKETSNSLYRQWQIFVAITHRKSGLGHVNCKKSLVREGIDISLRTIQRDLNQIAQRFPIESSKTSPQGWRWRADAPIQSLPHMTSSQAVTFMMVEEHLKHLLPPSLIEEMNPSGLIWLAEAFYPKQCAPMDQPCSVSCQPISLLYRQL